MKNSKLSPPVRYEGESIEQIIENCYVQFNEAFIKKEKRPTYLSKFIFFNMNKNVKNGQVGNYCVELDKPERFYHMISFEEKEKYQMYPCYNDKSYELCDNLCDIDKVSTTFKFLNRVYCLYRLSRIHRVVEVIELANLGDSNIEAWTEIELDKKRNKVFTRYIRYNCGADDYVIILREIHKKGIINYYEFITAFPVFLKSNKERFSKNYLKSQK